jgi:hypothetical protein
MSESEAARPRDCQACGARCCRHIALEIDKPTCKQDYDNVRWYLLHEGITVFVDHDGDWHVEFPSPCSFLGPDDRCRRYTERPRVCRDYPARDTLCEYETADQFVRYLEGRGIDWKFKKAKN